jgi:hypothetical protein
MPALLVGVGGVLIVLTFLLAFTIFGVISAVLGIACLVVGATVLSRRGGGANTRRRPGPKGICR